jgi:hypothetical protein
MGLGAGLGVLEKRKLLKTRLVYKCGDTGTIIFKLVFKSLIICRNSQCCVYNYFNSN